MACGVPIYGAGEGNGFADARWNDVAGVRSLIAAADRDDERPLWVALWGGANTLAQALWAAEQEFAPDRFARMLARLRVHSISDQDAAGPWLRTRYGARLFTIVSPSPIGGAMYKHATWPGLSGDRFAHGSEDGHRGGGFAGADRDLISRRWVKSVVRRTSSYGRQYPVHRFIMEGDSPSFLGLIPNGLNIPDRPDLGGWGGRYERYVPNPAYTGTTERFPVWTNAWDEVTGVDGRVHRSPQATIWRWRRDIQNDFLGRLRWTASPDRAGAPHPPKVAFAHPRTLRAHAGELVTLDASPSRDADGGTVSFEWIHYPEAGQGGSQKPVRLDVANAARCTFVAPPGPARLEFIVAVRTNTAEPMSRYGRVTVLLDTEIKGCGGGPSRPPPSAIAPQAGGSTR